MREHRRSSEVRQAELIEGALHIIATRGIAALSTGSLARQVGLTSGAIFRHFASMDALFDAVAARVEAVLDATYPPPGLPARERLERFVEARSAAVGGELRTLRLVLSEQFLLALPKGASERLSACVRKSQTFVRDCVREAQEAGELRGDADAGALAIVVMGTLRMLAFPASRPWRGAPGARTVRDALFALLRPPARTRSRSRR